MSIVASIFSLRNLLSIAFLGIAAIYSIGVQLRTEPIEQGILQPAQNMLQEAGFAWANPTISGRDLSLHGAAPSEAAIEQALSMLNTIDGARIVYDKTTLLAAVSPYTWQAKKDSDKLILSGHVPDHQSKNLLVSTANNAFPNSSDSAIFARGAPSDWLQVAAMAIEILQRNPTLIAAQLTDRVLHLTGKLDSPEALTAFTSATENKLPNDYTLSLQIAVPTPEPKPEPVPEPEPVPVLPQVDPLVAKCQQNIDGVMRSNQITFKFSSAEILAENFPLLKQLSEIFSLCSDVSLYIAGHTDNSGDPQFNLHLSINRAKSVSVHLSQLGVAENLITTAGFGSSQPMASNATYEGRATNRRIEFLIVQK